jgi:hypothetical protein
MGLYNYAHKKSHWKVPKSSDWKIAKWNQSTNSKYIFFQVQTVLKMRPSFIQSLGCFFYIVGFTSSLSARQPRQPYGGLHNVSLNMVVRFYTWQNLSLFSYRPTFSDNNRLSYGRPRPLISWCVLFSPSIFCCLVLLLRAAQLQTEIKSYLFDNFYSNIDL